MQPRTKRQKEVLEYVTRFMDRNGHKPSYQQIARHLGVSSRAGVQRHIAALESQGLITRRRENGSFGIELQLQRIANELVCGVELLQFSDEGPAYTVADRSVITIPRYLIGDLSPDEVFALRVPDDSLVDRQICPDDVIFLERRNYARRGQLVMANTKRDGTLLGLYNQQGRETEIRPANSEFEPKVLPADEVTVQGVMLGLLRFHTACPQ